VKPCRAVWRLAWSLLHIVHGLLICALWFPWLGPAARMVRVQWWSARMLRTLQIGVDASGTPAVGPVLLVANHVSWLDILVLNAMAPARFVAKADMRHWPLLGWLVACGGTLFIERERKRDALRVVHHVAEALRGGERVALFPEGTTADGHALLPFHANLLQAAIAVGTPVQPTALRFSDASTSVSPAAAYVGETTLLESVWAVVMASGMVAHIEHLAPMPSVGRERRELAAAARSAIAGRLDAASVTGVMGTDEPQAQAGVSPR
jgi:1-acyl-sn-glycerol-3-phosphate acyltransferase